MNFRKLFGRKEKPKWTIRYIVERNYIRTQINDNYQEDEIITFFLKEDQFGNRKVEHISYGACRRKDIHLRHEAEMQLWKETGILPEGAKDILIQKLKV